MQIGHKSVEQILEEGIVLKKDRIELIEQDVKKLEEFLEQPIKEELNEEQKKELYQKSREMWNNFRKDLIESEYMVQMESSELKFLKNLITRDLEYDENDLFIAIAVKNNVLDHLEPNQTQLKINIQNISLIHHLISQMKVKGLGQTSLNLAAVLKAIGEASIIYNHYDVKSKQLAEQMDKWILTLEKDDPAVQAITPQAGQMQIVDQEIEEVEKS